MQIPGPWGWHPEFQSQSHSKVGQFTFLAGRAPRADIAVPSNGNKHKTRFKGAGKGDEHAMRKVVEMPLDGKYQGREPPIPDRARAPSGASPPVSNADPRRPNPFPFPNSQTHTKVLGQIELPGPGPHFSMPDIRI